MNKNNLIVWKTSYKTNNVKQNNKKYVVASHFLFYGKFSSITRSLIDPDFVTT